MRLRLTLKAFPRNVDKYKSLLLQHCAKWLHNEMNGGEKHTLEINLMLNHLSAKCLEKHAINVTFEQFKTVLYR